MTSQQSTKVKTSICSGRARRREYWLFYLIVGVMEFFLLYLVVRSWYGEGFDIYWYLLIGYNLIVLPPSIAVTVRRLHDTNRSGLWMLSSIVPLIGSTVMLVFMLLNSHTGSNRYGLNPKDLARLFKRPAPDPDEVWE